MKTERFYQDVETTFWRVPKFIPLLFEKTQTGYLYCLLRAKRETLRRKKKINNNGDWFFYPEDWLQMDLRSPNSPNTIIKLLQEIKKKGLIDFKNDSKYPYTRRYKIIDERYNELAKEYETQINRKRREYIEQKAKEAEKLINSDEDESIYEDYDDFFDNSELLEKLRVTKKAIQQEEEAKKMAKEESRKKLEQLRASRVAISA